MIKKLVTAALITFCTTAAQAQTPTGSFFGALPAATFGGSGIPNGSVQQAYAGGGSAALTLGLSASQRCGLTSSSVYVCDGAPVTDNGAGTFFAAAGTGNVNPSPSNPYTTWNFNWYIGGTDIANYRYRLTVDFNPAVNSGGTTGILANIGGFTSTQQASWNLGMDFLSAPVSFDPNATGEYYFALQALDQSGVSVATSSILVSVAAVPEPSSIVLLAGGLVGLGLAARRRRV